jgi:GH43 family beta-xylosidase
MIQWMMLVFLMGCKEDEKPPVTPSVEENTFKNPMLNSAPDPWVIEKDNWYYITHTTGNSLRLYRTQEMSDLKSAFSQTVWTPPSTGMNSRNIWAPELHFIDDKWYFYYAADDGNNNNHRMWVLENTSSDPFMGTWVDKGELELPEDKWAIDATIFEHNEELYLLWSGWEGDVNVRQDIYITKMSSPWTAEGERVRISKPELPWELNGGTPTINEAPQFIKHNDKIFITYSASGCWTDEYSLGLLSANTSADLLDPLSWTKSNDPVLIKNASAQAYGPGHNAFFKSKDGSEDWIIYHANSNSGDGCGDERSTRMQKFTWNENGIPNFGTPVAVGAAIKVPAGEN